MKFISSSMAKKEAPLYRKLYEQLRQLIEDGTFKKGDLLPSENELCSAHHVTRPTVRNALNMLMHEGFIIRQQGKGSIVIGKPKGIGILSFIGTTSAIGKEHLTTKIIVKPHIRAWDQAFCYEISEMEKSVGCVYMERLRYINQVPLLYEITMIPNINIPRFTSRSFENKSMFEVLRIQYQIHVKGGEQKIQAITAEDHIQKFLEVSESHPILQLERKISTSRISFFFYSKIYCNTEEHSLVGNF